MQLSLWDSALDDLGVVQCPRCGQLCKIVTPANPQARPFQRAENGDGLCTSCIVAYFIQSMPVLMVGIERNGPEILLWEAAQQQFTAVLEAGMSDLKGEEINWERVVETWNLPWPKGWKPKDMS
jgi:hypothetical protein